jgi:hypothetical protein
MRALVLALTLLILSCYNSLAFAQTTLKVAISTGQFAWDNPVNTTATQNVVTCGSVSVVVPMPAATIAVSAVVPGPGTYTCTLYAENAFDKSAGPDPAFPVFQAGHIPPSPQSLRLEVR